MATITRRKVALDKIRIDGDTQPRVEIAIAVVEEYAELYEAFVQLPPLAVFFDGSVYWLADGFHRWHAARKAELEEVACEVHRGTVEDARWYSYAANQAHGLRRSNADKEKAVRAALAHPKAAGMSDAALAAHLGVHRNTVLKYREEPTCTNCASRTGRDGRTIDTGNIGKGGQRKQQKQQEHQKACPTCGGTEFDADGDCATCYEPQQTVAGPQPESGSGLNITFDDDTVSYSGDGEPDEAETTHHSPTHHSPAPKDNGLASRLRGIVEDYADQHPKTTGHLAAMALWAVAETPGLVRRVLAAIEAFREDHRDVNDAAVSLILEGVAEQIDDA